MDLRTGLEKFLDGHAVERAKTPPSREEAAALLTRLDMRTDGPLMAYLTRYGWLAYGSVEFLGASGDGRSDMADVTEVMRRYFPYTDGYAAVERLGDGVMAVCDAHGRMFRFLPPDELVDMHVQLEDYMADRFRAEA